MVELIAAIRIKGTVKTEKEIRDTLYLLKLRKNNVLAIYEKNDSIVGMLKKIEPWVAWGEIDKETLKQLLLKRGRLYGNKRLTEEYIKEKLGMDINTLVDKIFNGELKLKDIPGLKRFFRLKPPTKGFPRNGIKKPYYEKGAYGYWGKDINGLILRMI